MKICRRFCRIEEVEIKAAALQVELAKSGASSTKLPLKLLIYRHQLICHTAAFTAAIMSKVIVPSRMLLSSFSRSLRNKKPQPFTSQCHQLSTFTSTTLPRRQQCLRPTPKSGSPIRHLSSSSPRTYKTVQEQRSRYRSGVCFPAASAPSQLTQLAALLLESRPPLSLLRRSTDILLPI